jgi:hypothetical protein
MFTAEESTWEALNEADETGEKSCTVMKKAQREKRRKVMIQSPFWVRSSFSKIVPCGYQHAQLLLGQRTRYGKIQKLQSPFLKMPFFF